MKIPASCATFALCTLLALSAGVSARAQELALLGGTSDAEHGEGSYSWEISYRHRLREHLSLGVTYLNEGHLGDHHRDGYAPMVWGHLPLPGRVELSAGLGPYLYFDTVQGDATPTGYRNEHGGKVLTSLSAAWYSQSEWFLQLQGNYLALGSDPDTVTALAGIGYRFTPSEKRSSPQQETELPPNELNLLLGQTIANSLDSQKSVAFEVEYRHRLLSHLDGSIAFLFEGDSRLIRRDGVIAELWAVQDLLENRLTVGIGGGAYFDIETYRNLRPERVSGIATLTAGYRLHRDWRARISWNRIVTNYDRDSDVILAGAGYLF